MQISNSPSAIGAINSANVMSAIPILFSFVGHYLFEVLLLFRSEEGKSRPFSELSSKLVLVSLAALISSMPLVYSNFLAVMSWLTMTVFILLHYLIFLNDLGNRYRSWAFVALYLLLSVWYSGIIVIFLLNAFSP